MAKIKVDDLIYDNGGTDATVDLTTAFNNLGKLVKVHHFTYSTRTVASSSADVNQFTWTSTFSPLDATNNLFLFTGSVPVNGAGQYFAGYGLRVGNVDFQGYGSQYTQWTDESNMSQQSYYFQVGAGVLATSADQSIYHRAYTAGSHVNSFFPNSTENSRLAEQTRGFLTVYEYKS